MGEYEKYNDMLMNLMLDMTAKTIYLPYYEEGEFVYDEENPPTNKE